MANLVVLFSSLKMAIATALSRLFGLGRELVFAYYFGASGFADAFHVAYRIPNLLRDLLAEGAFSSAFVPGFTTELKKGALPARVLFGRVFLLMFILTAILSTLTYFCAPMLIHLFAPSFVENTEKFSLTVTMVQILSPFLILVALSAIFMGVLNTLKIFFWPSFSPALFNVAVIIFSVLAIPWFERNFSHGIYGFAWAIIIGGSLQFLALSIPVLRRGFHPVLQRPLLTYEVKKIYKKLGPGLVGFSLTQVNLLVNTILATSSGVGAVSWLNYAFRLFQLPVGVLGVSLGNSNLVHFSSLWANEKTREAKNLIAISYQLSWMIMLLPMVIVLTYAPSLVSLVFERGEFTEADSKMTALALGMYGVGLPFYGLYKLFVPIFYSVDKEKIPVYSSLIAIIVNILFCVMMVQAYGFHMLALGASLSLMVNCSILGWFLKRLLSLEWSFFFPRTLVVPLLFAAMSYLLAWYLQDHGLTFFFDGPYYQKVLRLVGSMTLIASFYLLGTFPLIKRLNNS